MADLYLDLSTICEAREVFTAPRRLHAALEGMLAELNTQRLEVGLIPSQRPDVAQRGGKIRQSVEQNPLWYRRFAAQYTARRTQPRNRPLHDTLIKRQSVIQVLQGLLGHGTTSGYAPALLQAAEEYQEDQDAQAEYYRRRQDDAHAEQHQKIIQAATPAEVDDLAPF